MNGTIKITITQRGEFQSFGCNRFGVAWLPAVFRLEGHGHSFTWWWETGCPICLADYVERVHEAYLRADRG